MKTFKLSLIFLSLFFIVPYSHALSPARSEMSVSPEALYAKMFDAIEAKDWDKLSTAAKLLMPLSQEIDNQWDTELTHKILQSIQSKNVTATKETLIIIVLGGVETLLKSSVSNVNPQERKDIVKQAFTEFLQIELYLKYKNLDLTEDIINDFRKMNACVTDASKYYTCVHIVRKNLLYFYIKD